MTVSDRMSADYMVLEQSNAGMMSPMAEDYILPALEDLLLESVDVSEADPELQEIVTSAQGAEGTARLHVYWRTHIKWGKPGDFNECVRHLSKYVRDPKGYCAKMHKDVTGATPGHAAGEAAVTDEPGLEEAGKVYHYRHGWIPLDHVDASSKHGLAVGQETPHGKIVGFKGEDTVVVKGGPRGGTQPNLPERDLPVERVKKAVDAKSGTATRQPGDSEHDFQMKNEKGRSAVKTNTSADDIRKMRDRYPKGSDEWKRWNAKLGPKSKKSEPAARRRDGGDPRQAQSAGADDIFMSEEPPMDTFHIEETAELTERANSARSGRWSVTAISAGVGSSGYYSPEVLEEASRAQLIKEGTPLFFDHPSETDRKARPERSVRDIAAVFTSPASYDPRSQALVGEVQVFGPYRELVNEMAPHIGLSISGSATDITEGEIDGKMVPVVEGLARIDSVDLVTRAGRGGQFVSLLESARQQMDHLHLYDDLEETQVPADEPETQQPEQPDPVPDPPPGEPTNPDQADPPESPGQPDPNPSPTQEAAVTETPPRNPREVMERQLQEQGRQISLLRAENTARNVVAEVLASGWIGEAQRARLATSLVSQLPLTEAGELDESTLRERAQNALDEAETEAAEILQAAGVGSPRGLGALETPATESAAKQYEDELIESFRKRGMSDAAIEIAVRGR